MTGVNNFIEELERYCYSSAVVTFLNRTGENFRLDLNREEHQGSVQYGYSEGLKELLMVKLSQGGVVVLRSFTADVDPQSELPVKEIRGFLLVPQGNDIQHHRLLPDDLFWSSTTDPRSGQKLAPEPAVRYC